MISSLPPFLPFPPFLALYRPSDPCNSPWEDPTRLQDVDIASSREIVSSLLPLFTCSLSKGNWSEYLFNRLTFGCVHDNLSSSVMDTSIHCCLVVSLLIIITSPSIRLINFAPIKAKIRFTRLTTRSNYSIRIRRPFELCRGKVFDGSTFRGSGSLLLTNWPC